MVAAFYPTYSVKGKEGLTNHVNIGKKKSKDPAYRCAYFAYGDLSVKDIRENRRFADGGAFALAAPTNLNVYGGVEDIRREVEEHCTSGSLTRLYLRRLDLYSRSGLDSNREELKPLTIFVQQESGQEYLEDSVRADIATLSSEVNHLITLVEGQQKSISSLGTYMGWMLVIAAALFAIFRF